MARTESSIVPDTIDDAYPVAGEDNDSQGFRDNFNIIKTNFTQTKSEIDELLQNAARKDVSNVFFENRLERFTALQASSVASDPASFPTGGPNEINFENGHFHEITLSNSATINVINFPTNSEYAELYMLLKTSGGTFTATFAPKYSNGTIDSTMHVVGDGVFGGGKSITTGNATSESVLIKAFTYDNGVNVFFEYLGKFVEAV